MRLPNVLAARCTTSPTSTFEIHLLATPGRPAEEIARDARSLALLNGADIAAEDIRVVQLAAAEQPADEQGDDAVELGPEVDIDLVRESMEEAQSGDRAVVSRIEVAEAAGTGRAVVTLGRAGRSASGTAVFVPAAATERRGVAEAAVASLAELDGLHADLAVDTAVVLSLPPNEIALVTIAVVVGGTEEMLVGATLVRASGVHDAIVRAVLDATNRWARRPHRRAAPR